VRNHGKRNKKIQIPQKFQIFLNIVVYSQIVPQNPDDSLMAVWVTFSDSGLHYDCQSEK
jgi:hypothetical protein